MRFFVYFFLIGPQDLIEGYWTSSTGACKIEGKNVKSDDLK
jgi:hypothetical protein